MMGIQTRVEVRRGLELGGDETMGEIDHCLWVLDTSIVTPIECIV